MTDDRMARFFLEQLDDPAVSARAMFGGYGIYRDGRMFALVYDGDVYVKVTDAEAETSERKPFNPRAGQTFPTYREVSADELDNPDALAALVARAQEAASAAKR